MLDAKRNAEFRKEARNLKPTSTFGKTKKRAGQSQIIAQKQFIQGMAFWSSKRFVGSRQNKATAMVKYITFAQKLANLKARYRF